MSKNQNFLMLSGGIKNGFDDTEASWMKSVCKVCQSCQLEFASTRISPTIDLGVIPNFFVFFFFYIWVFHGSWISSGTCGLHCTLEITVL